MPGQAREPLQHQPPVHRGMLPQPTRTKRAPHCLVGPAGTDITKGLRMQAANGERQFRAKGLGIGYMVQV